MIKPDAKLSIRILPLDCLQVKEYQDRYPERLMNYIQLMRLYPDEYAGLIHVVPSDTHSGMYAILDGHHKFAASIMAGRADAVCLIVEENV